MKSILLLGILWCGVLITTSAQSDIIELTPLYVIETDAFDVAWSYDGRYLSAATHIDVFIWDTETRTIITRFDCGDSYLSQTLSWHPNQLILAAGCEYEGEFVETLPINDEITAVRFNSYNQAVAWSPDGSQIAVLQEDSTIGILDTSFELLYALGEPYYPPTYQPGEFPVTDSGPGQMIDLKWSPNGNYLASTSMGMTTYMEIWDLETKEPVWGLQSAYAVIWSSQEDRFAFGFHNSVTGNIQSWSVSPLQMVTSIPVPRWYAYAIDGAQYIGYCEVGEPLYFYDILTLQKITLRNVSAPETFFRCPESDFHDNLRDLTWSSQSMLAIADDRGAITIWQVEN